MRPDARGSEHVVSRLCMRDPEMAETEGLPLSNPETLRPKSPDSLLQQPGPRKFQLFRIGLISKAKKIKVIPLAFKASINPKPESLQPTRPEP